MLSLWSPATRGRWAAAAATLGLVAAGTLTTVSSTAAATPATAKGEAPPGATTTRLVTLVTGDQVALTTGNGRTSVALRPPAAGGRKGGAFTAFRDGSGDQYVVPAAAEPYAGTQLDLSLFDVTALARQQGAAGRVPVTVSFDRGAPQAAPAGVTLDGTRADAKAGTRAGTHTGTHTGTHADSAGGFVTAASGAKLAQALRSRIGADVRAGRRPGTTPLFPGVHTLARTGAHPGATQGTRPAAPAAAPAASAAPGRYRLDTVTLTAEDRSGAAASGEVLLTDTDDEGLMAAVLPVDEGIEKAAVPDGHYSAAMAVADFDTAGDVTAQYLVTITDFTVTEGGTNTVDLDARTATAQVTAATPRPADADYISASWARTDTAGTPVGYAPDVDALSDDGTPVYAAAQPAAQVGKVAYFVQWSGHDPGARRAYRYELDALHDDVPADGSVPAEADRLATVTQHIFSDPAADPAQPGMVASEPLGDDTPFNMAATAALPMPAAYKDYLSTSNGGLWTQQTFQGNGIASSSDVRTYAAGHAYAVDWGRGPLTPGFGSTRVIDEGSPTCYACLADGDLTVFPQPLDDSDPHHNGGPSIYGDLNGASTLNVYRDGTLVAGDVHDGVYLPGEPASGAHYRVVDDSDFTGNATLSQATTTHTEWTFTDPEPTDTGSLAPAPLGCVSESDAPVCHVLPILTAHYRMATDAHGTSRAAVQRMGLDIGHVTYNGAGSHAPIASAAVQVSFDGGATWQPAHVTGDKGRYQASWANPAAARGTAPALRVTAADTAGGTLTQTIQHAYTIAADK